MHSAHPARLIAVGALGLLAAIGPVARAAPPGQDPTVAPATTLSADGRTASGAGKSLSVSQAHGLAAGGQTITVSGAGYDVEKGVYVTLCVIPPTNQPPSPCGGGQDRAGSSGAAAWVSSNPPDYAAGLTQPYQAGGRFSVTLEVQPAITPTLDCFSVRCAVVTRNDHTRGSDRSQDVFVPVAFAAAVGPDQPAAPTTTLAPVVTTTTVPTPDPSTLPPATTLSADGRSVTDGTRVLEVSSVDDLDPAGAELVVTGTGYDPAAGVYVALCAAPEPGVAPGPCTTGDGAAAWVASSPPDYGVDLAEPFDAEGAFEVTLTVEPEIDAGTDCREVACAIATRRDAAAAADRTSDLLVPVAFGDPRPTATPTTAPGEVNVASARGGGSSVGPLVVAGTALLAAVAGATAVVRRRRRPVTTA